MNIALYICGGILAILIFGVIIPRLMTGLPKLRKHTQRDNEQVMCWHNWDEFDGK